MDIIVTGSEISQSEDGWKLKFPYKIKTYVAVVMASVIPGCLNVSVYFKVIFKVWKCA